MSLWSLLLIKRIQELQGQATSNLSILCKITAFKLWTKKNFSKTLPHFFYSKASQRGLWEPWIHPRYATRFLKYWLKIKCFIYFGKIKKKSQLWVLGIPQLKTQPAAFSQICWFLLSEEISIEKNTIQSWKSLSVIELQHGDNKENNWRGNKL